MLVIYTSYILLKLYKLITVVGLCKQYRFEQFYFLIKVMET